MHSNLESDVKRAALDKDQAHARRQVCESVSAILNEAGIKLHDAGRAWGWDDVTGIGLMVRFASELSSTIVYCLKDHKYYSAAALSKQVVEIEYILWLMSEDIDAGRLWLNSSGTDMSKLFNASTLRKKSKGLFDAKEYWNHCDMAGHPNPKARILLDQQEGSSVVVELIWADLAQHLGRITVFMFRGLRLRDLVNPQIEEFEKRCKSCLSKWEQKDNLAIPLQTQHDTTDSNS